MVAGITGHVRIDDNGDRDADYSILDLDPITGRFEVVAHYYGLHRFVSHSPFGVAVSALRTMNRFICFSGSTHRFEANESIGQAAGADLRLMCPNVAFSAMHPSVKSMATVSPWLEAQWEFFSEFFSLLSLTMFRDNCYVRVAGVYGVHRVHQPRHVSHVQVSRAELGVNKNVFDTLSSGK